mmetsp:Transcript_81035/g.235003  ORF Transcript_81035/g.235003 Transcript_81035/m.235003 type:complete len:308 (-) Transcript_81035:18-941(-)|eukprot:CAMPEP_0176068010 /NCGR_PEP_ID=MMETSP0120_2-20121206/33948_1 /TAXON_ID=160619 /ORGANISM="Kryptoperidinium foliaceum, Strain CCMP 1326" /LENGTH=307 /DNA_ID=CAMNT_0017401629 /DNA_START=29 /DNA_END=952 /DNA_ORIENTATION=-
MTACVRDPSEREACAAAVAAAAIASSDHPDELLADMIRREAPRPDRRDAPKTLEPHARMQCLVMMRDVLAVLKVPRASFFQAAAVLDMCLDHEASSVEAAPELCAAIGRLLVKADGNYDARSREVLERATAWLGESLGCGGGCKLQDRAVLHMAGWRLYAPTVHDYLLAFCDRLDSATSGSFRDSIDWVKGQLVEAAQAIVVAVRLDSSPRAFASGLLCHGLVAAGLLGAPALLAAGTTSSKCLEEDLRAMPWPRRASHCELTEGQQRWVVDCLRLATGAERPELQQMVGVVGSAAAAAQAALQRAL